MARYSLATLALLASTAIAHPSNHKYLHRRDSANPPFAASNVTSAAGTGGTSYVTATSTSILYVTVSPVPETSGPVAASSSAPAVESSVAAGSCGPATITETATNYVTVTVPAGESSAAASSAAVSVPAVSSYVAASSSAAPYPIYNTTSAAAPSSVVVPPVESSSIAAVSSAAVSSSWAAPSSSAPYFAETSAASSSIAASSAPASSVAYSSAVVSSSSAAASATASAPAASGGKKGAAYNDASMANAFGSSVAWGYNWAASSSGLDSSISFVPMLHDLSGEADWSSAAQAAIDAGSTALMAYNEPDMPASEGGSDIPYDTAAQHYAQYMNPFAGKALLGAPAVTSDRSDSSKSLGYLGNFLTSCKNYGCHIDFISIHWYGDASQMSDLQSFVSQAAGLGYPVWVTEVQATSGDQASFISDMVTYFEGEASVAKYAYFMCQDAAGGLNSGTGLSALGQAYAS